MARKLKTFVTVHGRDGDGNPNGQSGTFGPKDRLPDWAAKQITNPDVWDDSSADEPAADDADQVAALRARIAELEQAADKAPDSGASGAKVPPRQGPGSGADKWREYAAAQQVEVAADASREDVIAALDQAGKPTK